MRLLICLILATFPLCAEFRKVEMTVGGLDCDSCALSVDRVVKRIRGVENATFDAKANLVTITLKADNTVKIAAIRDALKGVGYTPGDARVSARGSLSRVDGEWKFKPTGQDIAFQADLPESLKKDAGPDVIVEGTLSGDLLKVTSVK